MSSTWNKFVKANYASSPGIKFSSKMKHIGAAYRRQYADKGEKNYYYCAQSPNTGRCRVSSKYRTKHSAACDKKGNRCYLTPAGLAQRADLRRRKSSRSRSRSKAAAARSRSRSRTRSKVFGPLTRSQSRSRSRSRKVFGPLTRSQSRSPPKSRYNLRSRKV